MSSYKDEKDATLPYGLWKGQSVPPRYRIIWSLPVEQLKAPSENGVLSSGIHKHNYRDKYPIGHPPCEWATSAWAMLLYARHTSLTKMYVQVPEPIVDKQGVPAYRDQLHDRSDPTFYTLRNAPLIAAAGVISGFQEAFYKFDKMPPAVSRHTISQALSLFGIIGRRTLFTAGIGALFCYTEATVESMRGKHDMTSGMIAGAVAGLAFGGARPMPQPIFWPLAFALASVSADVVAEVIPKNMAGFKSYGPIPGRENWNDPAPPRPPILDTSAAVRPMDGGHFWRGN